MTIRFRTAFFIFFGLFIIWILYIERAILTPFVLAAIFAYIFNPVVDFVSNRIKLPRSLSIIIIYFFLIGTITVLSIILTKRIISESSEFKDYIIYLSRITKEQVSLLPDWVRPSIQDTLSSLEKSEIFSPQALLSFFPQAISRIISFLIFLFSGFYFLKDGRKMLDKALLLVPREHKLEVEILARKINLVLGGYLRGQVFLIFIVSVILFVALTVLGVKFALVLAIFSGFAETVPIIGPIVATTIVSIIALVTNTSSFSLPPLQTAMLVAAIYIFVRQVQDYLITPHIMGKITKLHPLIILFAVIAGGHLMGILGLILAVPIAATLRILLEFFLDKINEAGLKSTKKILGRE
ncbi:MAG: AI-2E family transporter [Candidatus Levybacteria bacterium]|nr:AI-2E family transporter [Candidatus Levybacteria bacterium]